MWLEGYFDGPPTVQVFQVELIDFLYSDIGHGTNNYYCSNDSDPPFAETRNSPDVAYISEPVVISNDLAVPEMRLVLRYASGNAESTRLCPNPTRWIYTLLDPRVPQPDVFLQVDVPVDIVTLILRR